MDRVRAFEETIAAARRRIGAVDFEWYPYGTLSATTHLKQLLSGAGLEAYLETACPSRRVLDVGSGDGELAFYLESLGYEVTAIDHPTHNHNGMRGLRALRTALGSHIDVHEVDLDRQFRLPHESYGVALFLGVLYHLRNPFYVLEELAKRVQHCLMSTRIARRLPDGGKMPKGVALAYLLDERELNQDDSNYFIFSEPALRVMLCRSYWQLQHAIYAGNTRSDPVQQDRDERIFCLLASAYDRLNNIQMEDGWYEAEGSGWRWTRQEFWLTARVPAAGTNTLAVQLFTPAELLERYPSLTLSISVNGRELPPAVLSHSGTQQLTRRFDSAGLDRAAIRFHLSHALAGDEKDNRERGIIVASVRIE